MGRGQKVVTKLDKTVVVIPSQWAAIARSLQVSTIELSSEKPHMTNTPNAEPTLTDVIVKLDKLSTDVDKLSTDVEKFNDYFSNYQQATQWVVQLAFTLIASATITVIITAVLRR